MRIVHFSDVHIGVENYGRPDPETGLSTRLGDFLASLDEVVDYAIDEGADLALFCGDAYKSRDPSQTHQREFARRVARLSTAGVPVFLLLGNHDMPHVASRATALEIFRTLDVPNVYNGDRAGTYVVETRDGPLQIVALPWIRRSGFLAREDMRGRTPDQVNEAIQRSLADNIRQQAAELDESVPAVFAGHVSVSEAEAGSEQSMMLGTDHVLLKSDLSLPQLDYVALGHVHRHQVLGRNPLMVYSGSLQRVDFGEEKDDKGFCVIDLDPSQPAGQRVKDEDFQFRHVDARRFLTVEVDVRRGDTDPTASGRAGHPEPPYRRRHSQGVDQAAGGAGRVPEAGGDQAGAGGRPLRRVDIARGRRAAAEPPRPPVVRRARTARGAAALPRVEAGAERPREGPDATRGGADAGAGYGLTGASASPAPVPTSNRMKARRNEPGER